MGYKMKGMSFKSSPMKQEVKEVEGVSIFGKSPKMLAIEGLKHYTGYNVVKNVYDKISGDVTKVKKPVDKKPKKIGESAITGTLTGGGMGMKKEKKDLPRMNEKK